MIETSIWNARAAAFCDRRSHFSPSLHPSLSHSRRAWQREFIFQAGRLYRGLRLSICRGGGASFFHSTRFFAAGRTDNFPRARISRRWSVLRHLRQISDIVGFSPRQKSLAGNERIKKKLQKFISRGNKFLIYKVFFYLTSCSSTLRRLTDMTLHFPFFSFQKYCK